MQQLAHPHDLAGEHTVGHAARFQCEMSRLGLGVMALDEQPLPVARLGTAASAAKRMPSLDPHLLDDVPWYRSMNEACWLVCACRSGMLTSDNPGSPSPMKLNAQISPPLPCIEEITGLSHNEGAPLREALRPRCTPLARAQVANLTCQPERVDADASLEDQWRTRGSESATRTTSRSTIADARPSRRTLPLSPPKTRAEARALPAHWCGWLAARCRAAECGSPGESAHALTLIAGNPTTLMQGTGSHCSQRDESLASSCATRGKGPVSLGKPATGVSYPAGRMPALYLAWLISNMCPSGSRKEARTSHADSAGGVRN